MYQSIFSYITSCLQHCLWITCLTLNKTTEYFFTIQCRTSTFYFKPTYWPRTHQLTNLTVWQYDLNVITGHVSEWPCHCAYPKPVKYSSHPICLKSIIIPSSHWLRWSSKCFTRSCLHIKMLYELSFPSWASRSPNCKIPDLTFHKMGELSCKVSHCGLEPLSPVTLSLVGLNAFLNMLFPDS
jgi:hypothetical protein